MKNKFYIAIILLLICFSSYKLYENQKGKYINKKIIEFQENKEILLNKISNTDLRYTKIIILNQFISDYESKKYLKKQLNEIVCLQDKLKDTIKNEANDLIVELSNGNNNLESNFTEQDFNRIVKLFNGKFLKYQYFLQDEILKFDELKDKIKEYYRIEKLKRRLMNPVHSWVGKTLEITFSNLNVKTLRNNTYTVTIIGVEKDIDGYEYFITKEPFTQKGHKEIYFEWFFSNMISDCYELKR